MSGTHVEPCVPEDGPHIARICLDGVARCLGCLADVPPEKLRLKDSVPRGALPDERRVAAERIGVTCSACRTALGVDPC